MTRYRAISLHQPYAGLIAAGTKTLETRTWDTSYRGQLLICSTQQPRTGDGPFGVTTCLVEVVGTRPMEPGDATAACIAYSSKLYVWELENVRPTAHLPIRGSQRFYSLDLDDNLLFPS